MKICSKCKLEKSKTDFYKKERGKDGLLSWCKECDGKKRALYYSRNRERLNKIQSDKYRNDETRRLKVKQYNRKRFLSGLTKKGNHIARLKMSYGITPEQVEELLKQQNNLCAICNNPLEKYHIDHDHRTKKVRGILCNRCNLGLGLFKDNENNLAAAINYLRKNT